ncbi:MAG: TraB/GumN family protein [Wenzhouxiangellaceae bacterium]|nr:TraB/GumN family protein [Wenzhouxiangellaceae bacterium]
MRTIGGLPVSLATAAIAVAVVTLGCAGMEPNLDRPALWRVSGPEGHEMWLFGSVHQLPSELQPTATAGVTRSLSSRLRALMPLPVSWYGDALHTAFRRAESVIVETTDALSPDQLGALAGRYEVGSSCASLSSYLSEPAWERLLTIIRDGAFGKDRPPRSATSALFALSVVAVDESSEPTGPGVDYWLSRHAARTGKTIIGLESHNDRILAIDLAFRVASCSQQAQLVEQFVDQLGAHTAPVRASGDTLFDSVELWRHGQTGVLTRELANFKSKSPILHDAFLGQRNRAWLPQLIEQIERRHSSLVVVGIGHLSGPDNLLAMLEDHGYRVRRVQ